MAAPSYIQEAETAWNSATSPKTTSSFNVVAGDLLVAFAQASEYSPSGVTSITLGISGGSLTWTQQQAVAASGRQYVRMWTAVVDSSKSMTVDFTAMGTNVHHFGGNVLTFRTHGGVGTSVQGTSVADNAPSVNLTTSGANSAVVMAVGDWDVRSGTRTARTGAGTFTETTVYYDASTYAAYGGYHADASTAGVKALGYSAPNMRWSLAAVEVLAYVAVPSRLPSAGRSLRFVSRR